MTNGGQEERGGAAKEEGKQMVGRAALLSRCACVGIGTVRDDDDEMSEMRQQAIKEAVVNKWRETSDWIEEESKCSSSKLPPTPSVSAKHKTTDPTILC